MAMFCEATMTQTPKPDLSEHEDEAVPFDEVMKKLVQAKPAQKKRDAEKQPKEK
jgi:hypothetical protein